MLAIVFDNPMRSYFPGQVVSGRVVVTSSSTQKFQGIKLKILGAATVRWTETRTVHVGTGSNRRTTTKTEVYSNSETYLSYKVYVAGDGRSTNMIHPGRAEFPFSLVLPPGLPSSFVSKFGNVTYSVEAVMKKSWSFDKKAKAPFTVNALADLNNDHRAPMPAGLRKTKTVGILCCVSGDIALDVKLPKSGFVPGEMLTIQAGINNMSSKRVECINFSLMQVRKYHAKTKMRSDTTIIATATRSGAEAHQDEVIRAPILQVPAVPPTGLGNCRIIEVDYKLHVEMIIPGPHINLRGEIPLIIGTIPLRQNFHELTRPPPLPPAWDRSYLSDDGRNANFAPTAPILPGDDYRDLPPPSYEDAVRYDPIAVPDVPGASAPPPPYSVAAGDEVDGSELGEDWNFVPKYPTWGFKKPQ